MMLRVFAWSAALALHLLLTGLVFPSLAYALVLLALWYVSMSGADWVLHKHVLHNDASPITAWREAHYTHHREFDGATSYKTGASLTFPWKSTSIIAFATLPAAALLARAWTREPLLLCALVVAHLVAISMAIGAHNFAHTHFHDYAPPSWASAPCVRLPPTLLRVIHEHHELHHEDARFNLCTILLGFDVLVGTQAWALPPPSRHWPPKAVLRGLDEQRPLDQFDADPPLQRKLPARAADGTRATTRALDFAVGLPSTKSTPHRLEARGATPGPTVCL